jgi:hypothetical protein
MPSVVTGYKVTQPPASTTLRVFQQETGGQLIDQFPSGMNGCSQTFWTLRWRSLSPDVTVTAFLTEGWLTAQVGEPSANEPRPVDDVQGTMPAASTAGYLAGTFCEQPAFLFGTATDGSNLIDVTIDYQVWNASP